MRKEPQIFTNLQRQNQSLDPELLEDLEFAEIQTEVRRRIRSLAENVLTERAEVIDTGKSPLKYHGYASKKRLIVVDKEAPDAEPSTHYYKDREIWRRYTKNRRRRLKKPKLEEVIPGAPPHTVAFLDYSPYGEDGIFLDYLHVRDDMRGQGHARMLVQAIIDKNSNLKLLHFGKMMREEIGHLKDSFAKKYEGKIDIIGSIYY